MILWKFFIDELQIDEPIGFDEIVLEINRDDTWHGVFFEASTSDLRFYGPAADYLRDKCETVGLKSQVIFKAESKCDGELEFTEILRGKLNFGRYKETCGNDCMISMNVEQENCTMTMRNRYDQKVEVERNIAFDNFSALAIYDKINFDMDLPAKELQVKAEGFVADAGDTTTFDDLDVMAAFVNIRPVYINEKFNSIETGQIAQVTSPFEFNQLDGGPLLSPQLLMEANPLCFDGLANYEIRLKGNYAISGNNEIHTIKLRFLEFKPLGPTSHLSTSGTVIREVTLFNGVSSSRSGSYDQTWIGTIDLLPDTGYYAFIQFSMFLGDFDISNTFDKETYFNISINKACPTTTSKVFAIHETLSRVSEAITNNCLKVKSDYYGRTDSQPYTASVDGCGGLRVVTAGLHIRKDANARFFASLKELYEGLKAIDNIGMGIEPNPNITGFDWLRIEDINYFYQDVEILSLPFVPNTEKAIDESKHYSLIKVGYKKWEVENVNGLDEPNSNKEYRTSLSSVNNTLDITSNLISGSYPIEITRQQSFAVSGGADTKFDNEIFIICVDRAAYGFTVEQGNISGPGPYAAASNIYSPDTLYNWRIRPYYNLMRWFKSIINSYPNLIDSDNKLFFGSGTGNYLAEGELIDGIYDASGCKLENGPKAENDDLGINDFLNQIEGTPIDRPETIRLKYPLSIREYRLIKSNPYGYLSVQCGTSDTYLKGFIKQIQYKPTKGDAEFLLKLKWQ